jgi:hypothetical protein
LYIYQFSSLFHFVPDIFLFLLRHQSGVVIRQQILLISVLW